MTVQIALPRVEKGIWTSSIILPPVGTQAAATRALERLTSTTALLRNSKPATYFMEFVLENRADPNFNITLMRDNPSAGTNLAQVYIARGGTGLTTALQLRDSAGNFNSAGLGDAVVGRNRIAMAVAPNYFAACLNGGTPRVLTSGTDFASLVNFASQDLPGGIRNLRVHPQALSTDKLQAMTTL